MIPDTGGIRKFQYRNLTGKTGYETSHCMSGLANCMSSLANCSPTLAKCKQLFLQTVIPLSPPPRAPAPRPARGNPPPKTKPPPTRPHPCQKFTVVPGQRDHGARRKRRSGKDAKEGAHGAISDQGRRGGGNLLGGCGLLSVLLNSTALTLTGLRHEFIQGRRDSRGYELTVAPLRPSVSVTLGFAPNPSV